MSRFIYSLLKGRALAAKPFPFSFTKKPHYHLLIQGPGTTKFDVAVNIASESPQQRNPQTTQGAEVLFAIKDLTPRNAEQLKGLSEGIRNLSGSDIDSPDADAAGNAIPGLDFVADGLVRRDEMALLPLFDPAHGLTGSEAVMDLVNDAVNNPKAMFYVFGHRYDDNRPRNDAWHFTPDDGVHNIHMNQGNARGNFDDENGRHEDGALLIHIADTDAWHGVFIAFQNQNWDNDDKGFPKGGRGGA